MICTIDYFLTQTVGERAPGGSIDNYKSYDAARDDAISNLATDGYRRAVIKCGGSPVFLITLNRGRLTTHDMIAKTTKVTPA